MSFSGNITVPNLGALVRSALDPAGTKKQATKQYQSFSTKPLINTRAPLFTLSIRYPASPNEAVPGYTYTFPISPSNVSKDVAAMTNFYDVGGRADNPGSPGVQRIVDEFGLALPVITLDGTTGWKKHSLDGGTLSGLESAAKLQELLSTYASWNRQQQLANNPDLYQLEYYDHFLGEFWQVVPFGGQSFRLTSARPIIVEYTLRFAAVRSLDAPVPAKLQDVVSKNLFTKTTQSAVKLSGALRASLGKYGSVTAGAFGVSI